MKTSWAVLLIPFVTALGGCDDAEPTCEGVAGACEAEGAVRCDDSARRVVTCAENADGCLVWTDSELCSAAEACVEEDGTAECLALPCTDRCGAGQTRCTGDRVMSCEEAEDGCLDWAATEDCAASGQTCDDSSGTPECVAGCSDECAAEGDGRCVADLVQLCTAGLDGCLYWEDETDCAETDQTCDDSSGTPECVAGCSDRCEAIDATRCFGDLVETCGLAASGCLDWSETEDCGAREPAEVCDESSGAAACVAGCSDECATAGSTRCDGDLLETCTLEADGCRRFVPTEDCAASDPPERCDAAASPAACVLACEDTCAGAGETRCQDDAVQTCELGADGCLHFVDTEPCDGPDQYCDETGPAATCESCVHECETPGGTGCDGTVVRSCVADAHGCRAWAPADDCAALVPPADCVVVDGDASCEEHVGAGSCEDPIVAWTGHLALAGSDFTATFTDDVALAGTGCTLRTGSVEAVFAVDMVAGETLRIRELGTLDIVTSVQTACGAAEACVFSRDSPETNDYTATADGRVYVIIEAWSATPYSRAYDIRLDVLAPEACDNGVDDDADGLTDCDDPECFGLPGCTVELSCADGRDNDADGLTDCADPDCAAEPACLPRGGYYQSFDATDRNDLLNCTVTFTPDATLEAGYAVSTACDCLAPWVVEPGSAAAAGGASTPYTLGDDASSPHDLTVTPGLPFFGTSYTSFWVGSNGYVTLNASDTSRPSSAAGFWSHDRIAPLAVDLNPDAVTTEYIVVDELPDRVAVSWVDVPFYSGGGEVTMQAVVFSTGVIQLVYREIGQTDRGWTGIAQRSAVGLYPAETDYTTPRLLPPSAAGDVFMTEVMWDPNAATDDRGEYIELYNRTATDLDLDCCIIEDLFRTHSFSPVVVPAGGYLVLVRDADPALNGGISGGYALGSSIQLRNSAAVVLTLTCNGLVIDTLPFDTAASWPAGRAGVSMQLSSAAWNASTNDIPGAWCDSATPFGAGDLGSPGAPNAECPAPPREFLALMDLEADPGWTLTGDWQWGEATVAGPAACASGTGCFGTNLAGNYAVSRTYAGNYVQSGAIDLSGAISATLTFSMWLHTELDYDFARVLVSTDGSSFATLPVTSPAYNRPTSGTPTEWSGSVATSWTGATADLSAFAGSSTVYLRWALRSDSSYNLPGFYVDDVRVHGTGF